MMDTASLIIAAPAVPAPKPAAAPGAGAAPDADFATRLATALDEKGGTATADPAVRQTGREDGTSQETTDSALPVPPAPPLPPNAIPVDGPAAEDATAATDEDAATSVTDEASVATEAVDPSTILADLMAVLTRPATPDHDKPAGSPATATDPAPESETAPAEAVTAPATFATVRPTAGAEEAGPATDRGAPAGRESADSAAVADRPAADPTAPAVATTAASATTVAEAPAAPAAVPRALPVPLEPEALGLAIARHASEGADVFEISLTPDELGRIDVRLEIGEDGRVAAHVAADRPETLALLQRDRGELARALAGQGLNADQASLNFTLRDAGGAGANAQGFAAGTGNGGNGGQGGERRGRPRGGAVSAALEAAAPRPATPRSRAIDIAV